MQFLLSLVALALIVYGVTSANLLWVFAGVAAVALLSSGRLGRATAGDASRFVCFGKALIGPLWRQLLLAALVCSGLAGWASHKDPFAATSGYLWLVGLALIVAAGFLHDRKASEISVTDTEAASSDGTEGTK